MKDTAREDAERASIFELRLPGASIVAATERFPEASSEQAQSEGAEWSKQGRHRHRRSRRQPAGTAIPVVMQKKKMLIGLFGMAVNSEFNYPKYSSMITVGPDPEERHEQGFLQSRHFPETEAADGCDRGSRCGNPDQRLRRCGENVLGYNIAPWG
jgi:hypothetical protein